MIWLLAACELQVDFDPETTPPVTETPEPPSTPEEPTVEPTEPPRLVVQTACTGNPAGVVPSYTKTYPPFYPGIPGAPAGPTVAPEDVGLIFFALDAGSIVVEPGPEADIVITADDALSLYAAVGEGVLAIAASCDGPCPDATVHVAVPAAVDQIVGHTVGGDVTVDHAAVWDVAVATFGGDVSIRGDTRGVRAGSPTGDITVELPSADVVDLEVITGDLTIAGSVAGELCAEATFGRIDAQLHTADVATLRPGAGVSTIDIATAPSLVDLQAFGGDLRLRLPGGGYAVDVTVPDPYELVLTGIVDDPSASSTVRGFNLDGPVTVEAR